MKTYFEIIAQDILPAMRALIAKELMEKHGFTQTVAADKMGVTQAAVSQYMRNIRGFRVKKLENDEKTLIQISELSNKIAEGKMNIKDSREEMCNICEAIREKEFFVSFFEETD